MECSAEELLRLLLDSSERAAELARTCRRDPLFEQGVQSKPDLVKNSCTVQDFKTVADVTVQVMVRHQITAKYPDLAAHILGEESGEFTAADGSSLQLAVQPTQLQTTQLLCKALGEAAAAERMAQVVHAPPQGGATLDEQHAEALSRLRVDVQDLAVWIDPIDCTSEYVTGEAREEDSGTGLPARGLSAVTVLVGVFSRSSGDVLMGVVTQPFGRSTLAGWASSQYWGVCCGSLRLSNMAAACGSPSDVVVTSSSERADVVAALRGAGLRPVAVSGAGYKLLQVALGAAAAYVVSISSTFLWDSCGPEALIRARGGTLAFLDGRTIRYNSGGHSENRNQGCLVAALSEEVLGRIRSALKQCDGL